MSSIQRHRRCHHGDSKRSPVAAAAVCLVLGSVLVAVCVPTWRPIWLDFMTPIRFQRAVIPFALRMGQMTQGTRAGRPSRSVLQHARHTRHLLSRLASPSGGVLDGVVCVEWH